MLKCADFDHDSAGIEPLSDAYDDAADMQICSAGQNALAEIAQTGGLSGNFEWVDLQQLEVIVRSCRTFLCQFFRCPENEDFVILSEVQNLIRDTCGLDAFLQDPQL